MSSYLGPCVSETSDSARSLMEKAMRTSSPGGWCWDLLPKNLEAVALARLLDFTPKRDLTRMVRGREQLGNQRAIYAIAGFELG